MRLVNDMKSGKSTFLDEAADPFAGEIRRLAQLNVSKPTFLIAEDFNGDKKADLLVGTGEGARVFVQTASGFGDATEASGLKGVAAGRAAFAAGKGLVLLGSRIYAPRAGNSRRWVMWRCRAKASCWRWRWSMRRAMVRLTWWR